ncbi:MAG: hypothetical protein HKP61_18160 [Dactylosporangium sp.]|nr:hypothetical protein [Dactylosporangium sp.]NNJ62822.1 hypothetical protein [Dactylosporangium sp.]
MRLPQTGSLLAFLAVVAFGVAGCGGGSDDGTGVATAGGGARSSASASAGTLTEDERKLRFTQCLREQGLDVADPEPGVTGRIAFGEDADPNKIKAAQQACNQYTVNGGEPQTMDPAQLEQARQFSTCMRENGIPDFPDPAADGSIKLGQGAINRDDPNVKTAIDKCQALRPSLGARGGTR